MRSVTLRAPVVGSEPVDVQRPLAAGDTSGRLLDASYVDEFLVVVNAGWHSHDLDALGAILHEFATPGEDT
jgi:hypothetical protein